MPVLKKRKKRIKRDPFGRTQAEIMGIVKRSRFLKKLMAEFGARLSAFDPGVMAIPEAGIDPKTHFYARALNFQAFEWNWLEPLLIELRDYRNGNARA